MAKIKTYILDNEYYLDVAEPEMDPQTVAEAQDWYVQFTGDMYYSKTMLSLEEIVEMYEMLNKTVDKVPF